MGSSPIGRPPIAPRSLHVGPAIVLAGGEARRMGGGDKTLLPLGGRPILARILERLDREHAPVAISANGDPDRFAPFGRPVLADPEPGLGPLGGILAGLDWAHALGATHLLTVPGDAPFLPLDLARQLRPAPAMAASLGREHPPVALWPTGCRDALRRTIAATLSADRAARRVGAFARLIGMRVVPFDAASDGLDPFDDVDTPDDLRRAAGRLGRAPA